MGVKGERVGGFLEALAAATPTPGGGSASALAGAIGAALSRMVARLARDKKGYEAVQPDLLAIEAEASALQARLLALADEDAKAYDAVVAAMKLPKGTDVERSARVRALQVAYREATRVPLDTMEACAQVIELAARALEKGHRGAITDVGVAVLLAEAGLRGAGLNVRVNLASLKDETYRSEAETRLASISARAQAAGHDAMAVVEGRL